jgi:hypothetical protein
MFNKLFGKKDGFYMQVDESAPPKANAPEAPVAKAPKTEVTPTETIAATEAVAVTVAAKESAAKNGQGDTKAKSAKTSIKNEKKKEAIEAKPEATTVVVVSSAPAITNFATDYLVIPAVAGIRRRPGANMKGFMTMAREVKETKKGSIGNLQKIEKVEEAKKA